MRRPHAKVLLISLAVAAFWLAAPAPARADPSSSCNSTITICDLYERSPLDIGNLCCFVSGDWILLHADGTISDVLRFFNNFKDTGAGTGLGTVAFLYSDDPGVLPATFSVNAKTILEGPPDDLGETLTTFTSNGTLYRVHGHESTAQRLRRQPAN